LLRILDGKAPEANRIQQLKDRGVCSNAESQGQQSNNNETWIEAEHSDGVSQILAKVFYKGHNRTQMHLKGRGAAIIQVIENPTSAFVLRVRH